NIWNDKNNTRQELPDAGARSEEAQESQPRVGVPRPRRRRHQAQARVVHPPRRARGVLGPAQGRPHRGADRRLPTDHDLRDGGTVRGHRQGRERGPQRRHTRRSEDGAPDLLRHQLLPGSVRVESRERADTERPREADRAQGGLQEDQRLDTKLGPPRDHAHVLAVPGDGPLRAAAGSQEGALGRRAAPARGSHRRGRGHGEGRVVRRTSHNGLPGMQRCVEVGPVQRLRRQGVGGRSGQVVRGRREKGEEIGKDMTG
ncbi:hypothetical protein THAOC_21868, partial [Thalassiosira oceanica]